jgi:hypothetical protein
MMFVYESLLLLNYLPCIINEGLPKISTTISRKRFKCYEYENFILIRYILQIQEI